MNTDTQRMVLVILGGIAVVVGLSIIALAVTYPEVVEQSALGAEFFLADLSVSGSTLQELTGFRPLADGLLLVGSYVLVSLVVWGQSKLSEYTRMRKHFR
jgi:hypothetical protein